MQLLYHINLCSSWTQHPCICALSHAVSASNITKCLHTHRMSLSLLRHMNKRTWKLILQAIGFLCSIGFLSAAHVSKLWMYKFTSSFTLHHFGICLLGTMMTIWVMHQVQYLFLQARSTRNWSCSPSRYALRISWIGFHLLQTENPRGSNNACKPGCVLSFHDCLIFHLISLPHASVLYPIHLSADYTSHQLIWCWTKKLIHLLVASVTLGEGTWLFQGFFTYIVIFLFRLGLWRTCLCLYHLLVPVFMHHVLGSFGAFLQAPHMRCSLVSWSAH